MRLLTGLLALLITMGLSTPVSAESSWTTMHPFIAGETLLEQQSFAPTPAAAARQLRDQGYSNEQAVELEEQLTRYLENDPVGSTCGPAESKPGMQYAFLSFNRPGELPGVGQNQVQRLGVTLPVIACAITGISQPVHWFYNEDDYASFSKIEGPCNNVGVLAPVRAAAPVVQPKKEKVCRMVAVEGPSQSTPTIVFNIPSLTVKRDCGCDITIPGQSGVASGSNINTTHIVKICE